MLTAKVFYPVGREIRVYEVDGVSTTGMRSVGRRGVEMMRGHGAAVRPAFMRGVATADYVVPVSKRVVMRAKVFAIADESGVDGFATFVEGRMGRDCEAFGLGAVALDARGVLPANALMEKVAGSLGVRYEGLSAPGLVFFADAGAPVEYIAAMLLSFAEGLKAAGEQEVTL